MKKIFLYGFIVLVIVLVISKTFFSSKKTDDFNTQILIEDPSLNDFFIIPAREFIPTLQNIHEITTMEEKRKYIYTIDPTAYVKESDINLSKLLEIDLATNLSGREPRILIFHTHSQEFFIDSIDDNPNESIVAVGRHLANIFALRYGVSVVHDIGIYDMVDGELRRAGSYEVMEPAVSKILEKYPSIEIMIDLHRDGVPDDMHLVTEINGKPTAQLMFFNGITRLNKDGNPVELPELQNPYLTENLAFSLRAFLTANELYEGLMRNIYVKPYRYSLHLRPKSLLVEVGANTNTLEEAMNAMQPLARIIMEVLNP